MANKTHEVDMFKKFSFNFKFLDRFKKKSADNGNEAENEIESPDDFQEFNEMKIPTTRSTPPKFDALIDSEFDSPESSEDFAEKTLSNFKMPEELDNNIRYQVESNREDTDFDIELPPGEMIREMSPPSEVPGIAKGFKIKFPSFNRPNFKNLSSKSINLKNPFSKVEKLSWSDLVSKIFSPYSRPKIHRTFIVLLLLSSTYFLGKTIALLGGRMSKVEVKTRTNINIPDIKEDSSLSDINKISSVNLFNARESEEQKKEGPKLNIEEIVCVSADRPTQGQLKLLDTIVLQDSVKSVASVQVRGAGDLVNIREGEKLDNLEISKIERMKLILKNLETGDCEYLASEREDSDNIIPQINILPASKAKSIFKSMNPNIKNEGNNFKISRKYRDEMVSKMSDVLTQARAIQITNPDGTLCFKMTEVVPGSIYTQLNIQENDIVCSLNGRKIDNLNDLMGMFGKIKEIDSMQIGLKRNGINENFDYNFE